MKHYTDQIKHYQEQHLAAKDVGDEKLADECQSHINNYKEMQSQIK